MGLIIQVPWFSQGTTIFLMTDPFFFLPGLREVWSFTSLESNLKVGATLGDVGPLDPSFEATPVRRVNEAGGWVRRDPSTEVLGGIYIEVIRYYPIIDFWFGFC